MNLLVYSLFPALMLLLFGGLSATLYQLMYRPDDKTELTVVHVGRAALGLFFVWICLITIWQKQIPVLTFGQLTVFLAFLIWMGYSYVQTRIPQKLLALLPMLAVVVLILAAVVAGVHPGAVPEKIRGPWAAWHITLSLAGIAMLLGSGVFAIGTLVLHRHLARRVFDRFFAGLPSLDDMNRLRKVALYSGWVLVSLSLGSALIWMVFRRESSSVISHLHPMITLWAIVTALVLAERKKWIAQHRLAFLTSALAVLVFALMVVSVVEIFAGEWL